MLAELSVLSTKIFLYVFVFINEFALGAYLADKIEMSNKNTNYKANVSNW